MTTTFTDGGCANEASSRGSPGVASIRMTGSADTGGRSNALCAWLTGYRRLTIRYERHGEHFAGFLHLAAALTCFKKLPT
jgi:hypothetical protein